MSDELSLDEVEDARTDKEYEVTVTLRFGRNGDGQDKPVKIWYRPLTPEITAIPGVASQLAQAIIRWGLKEEPTFDVLKKRPLPFLNKIAEAITSDFFRERES